MAPFHSFAVGLSAALLVVRPKRILEFGPGLSTQLMCCYPFVESILSLEHDPHWSAVWRRRLPDPRVTLVCIPNQDAYVAHPEGLFDLVLVDGRRRPMILDRVRTTPLLRNRGMLLLHDAERRWCQEAIRRWPYAQWVTDGTTAALTLTQSTMDEWVRVLRTSIR